MGADTKPVPTARQREVFLGALEKTDPAERARFLDAACAGDVALRRGVEELLREQEEVGGFLETPAMCGAVGPKGTEVIAAVTEKPGDRIGRYKLLQQVGEGGCGVVYMAEQEEPVRRRVALKVIKLGMDTKSVIARFEAERQALAMMDHPNIAKVLDAGATETGRPFFVMELVRGVRITEYCDQNNLPPKERLELLIRVCQAIQHAHQKGVIHRDIKPSNILVTLHDGVPVPKVIDFGIAKATEQRLTDKTLFTEFQSFIGTPAYMSPEQAEMSGLDIDTRSDIYSLGVLLYELLVGKTPFDAETLVRAGIDECRRTIREAEPVRPSTRLATMLEAELTTTAKQRRTEAGKLIHLLRGDLDWIAMKCLEKDRARRYATANDLATDLQRYLDGEPVLARPPSNVYRLRKMLRRHRGAFAAAASIAAVLVVGASVSAWQAVRATRAERAALASQRQEAHLRRQAEQEETLARLNEYVADINLAQQSLAAENFGRAVELLAKHTPQAASRRPPAKSPPPGAGVHDPELRGFEWRYLWQLSRGDAHVALPAQDGPVQALAVSPGGDLLAVGVRVGRNERLNIWSLRTRALLTTLHKGAVSLAFYPDGKKLVAASPTSVRVWNTADWTEEKHLADNTGPVALSSDATRLATVAGDGVRVWDTTTWSQPRVLDDAWGPLVFSPDGKTLATDSRAGLTLWPLDGTGREVVLQNATNLFARPGPFTNLVSRPPGPRARLERMDRVLAFSPDGKWVVAARNTLSERGVFVLSIWNAQTGAEEASMPADAEHVEHAGVITSLGFSPDGRTLATASMDYSVRLWDFAKRQPIAALHGHLSEVASLAFLPDGQSLVSGAKDGELKLWSARAPRKEEVVTGVRHPLGFSRNGSKLAGLTRDGSAVVLLDLATSELEEPFQLEREREGGRGRFGMFGGGMFGPIALSDDLRTLAQGLHDGTVKLVDTATRESTTLKVSDGPVDLELSPDGRVLITRGRDWLFRRWDLRHGTNCVWPADAFKLLFSPDGRRLATLGRGEGVQIWDADSLAPLVKLETDEQPPFFFTTGFPAAFTADGRLLAVVYQDDAIRLWDTQTGQLVGVCAGHKQVVRSVAFSPDGKTLVTASDDSTVKFWNVATQQELLTIRQLGATLTGLMFSPDGRLLVGGSGAFAQSGGLRFFRAPLLSEIDGGRAQPERGL